jgi:hypothetical protein
LPPSEKPAPEPSPILSDGVETEDAADALNRLAGLEASAIRIIGASEARALALTGADNGADRLSVTASRLDRGQAENFALTASDSKGREIASGEIRFRRRRRGQRDHLGPLRNPQRHCPPRCHRRRHRGIGPLA